jgi:hypothetical protein
VGVNLTLIVQVAPAFSVLPQMFVCAKSPVAAPTDIVVDKVPVFFTVTTLAALVVPTVCAGNVSLVGVTVTAKPPETPVPERVTVWGEFAALSVIVIVPGRLPVVVGENVTVTVQVAPPANAVPQVFVWP